jgi:DNA-binding GntR family transcriptional regulator
MKKNSAKIQLKSQHRTVPGMITDSLREAILQGELKGGEQLKQDELGGRLGVSLSPIREALKNLEAEGLVQFYPNRGVMVVALSAEEAQEIFEIRIFLESGALELSIPNLSQADLNQAEKLLIQGDCEEYSDKWSELNWQFHEVIYQGAKKPRLLHLIRMMHNNVERYMRLYLTTMNYQVKSQEEHRALLEACASGDVEAGKTILRKHMEAASSSLITYLKTSGSNMM